MCGLAFFYAAWRITGDLRAASSAGCSARWYPFHAEHYSHLELHWVMFVAARDRSRYADARGSALPSTGLRVRRGRGGAVARVHVSRVMLLSFLAPWLAVVALARRPRRDGSLIALPAAGAMRPGVRRAGLPYLSRADIRGERAIQEVVTAARRAWTTVTRTTGSLTYQLASVGAGTQAGTGTVPGYRTLALAAAGACRRSGPPRWRRSSPARWLSTGRSGLDGLTYDDSIGCRRSIAGCGCRRDSARSWASALALLGSFGMARPAAADPRRSRARR